MSEPAVEELTKATWWQSATGEKFACGAFGLVGAHTWSELGCAVTVRLIVPVTRVLTTFSGMATCT